MTRIICSNVDCLHCEQGSHYCQKDIVCVGDDYTYGCEDYIAYDDTEEYKAKYCKAVKTKDGKVGKAVAYGKKIEYNGRTFYTEDRVTDDECYAATEERTGYHIGRLAGLKDVWEKFLEREKKLPDVSTYPLAVKVDGGYQIVEDQTCKANVKS